MTPDTAQGTAMTYNFDPDAWYDREFRALQHKQRNGTLSEADFRAALADLEQRYQDMLDRLSGTYQLPPER